MKLVTMKYHHGIVVYGYTLPDTPEGSVWWSMMENLLHLLYRRSGKILAASSRGKDTYPSCGGDMSSNLIAVI